MMPHGIPPAENGEPPAAEDAPPVLTFEQFLRTAPYEEIRAYRMRELNAWGVERYIGASHRAQSEQLQEERNGE